MKEIYSLVCALAVSSLSAFGAQYSTLAVSGTAVESGGDIAMRGISANGGRPSCFVAYLKLNPGTFTLVGTDAEGNKVTLGTAPDGAMADGGPAVAVTEAQVVQMTLTTADNSLDIKPLNALYLKGSIVPDNVTLDYAGRGVWRSTVTLDRQTSTDYSGRNFYFLFNNDESLAVKRHWGTPNVDMPAHGYSGLENIRLNQGTYDICLDMSSHTFSIEGEFDPMRVSVFGSSVANGQGAASMEGYAYMYGEQLKERYTSGLSSNPLYTSGVAIGGNTTKDLHNRYDDMLHDFSRYVIIGLSMGNEGIHDASDRDAVFRQFRDNMLRLIEKMRADGKCPIVVNNYTRSDYNATDYDYIKRMNMLIHSWDVPSVNSLGAIDDGAGHWSEGYIADAFHPNTLGHREFMYAIVPSLFDALIAGKPLPVRDTAHETTLGNGDGLVLKPEGKVHPFTVCVRVKGAEAGRLFTFEHGAGNRPFQGWVSVEQGGAVTYNSPLKGPVTSELPVMADGEWHDIALTHYFARGYTALYVDGVLAGEVDERLTLGDVTFGDRSNTAAVRQFSEISFWRSGMNADEMQAHHNGEMLKSSLEIYSPMQYDSYGMLPNLAQSTNAVVAGATSDAAPALCQDRQAVRVEGGKGRATFFGDGTAQQVYSADGRLVATVSPTPAGTELCLSPGFYIAGSTRFAVR